MFSTSVLRVMLWFIARLARTLLVLSLLSFAMLEIVLRVSGVELAGVKEDPVLNHRALPNHETWDSGKLYAKNNSNGWPERFEFESEHPGVFRIVFLGDSFTYGTEFYEESMPRRVEAAIRNTDPPLAQKLQIINAGTSSYSPLIYYLQLKAELLRYKPNAIFISVDITDVVDDYLYSRSLTVDAKGEPVACPPNSVYSISHARVRDGLRRRGSNETFFAGLGVYSKAVRLATSYYSQSQYGADADSSAPRVMDWCADTWTPETAQLVLRSMNYLRMAIDEAKKREVEVFVTLVPRVEHFNGGCTAKTFGAVREVAEAAGAKYFDSFSAIRTLILGYDAATIYALPDIHFNAKGYAIWAEAVSKYLVPQIHE